MSGGGAPRIKVIVDADATERALADLTLRQLNAAVRKGVSKATTVARAEAKKDAPKRTGTLRKSLSKKTRSKGGLSYGEVYVKPAGYYGKFVENGTVKMKAEPFMKPAETKVTPLVPGLIEVEIDAAIIKAGL